MTHKEKLIKFINVMVDRYDSFTFNKNTDIDEYTGEFITVISSVKIKFNVLMNATTFMLTRVELSNEDGSRNLVLLDSLDSSIDMFSHVLVSRLKEWFHRELGIPPVPNDDEWFVGALNL